jgi:hypothetical protein
MFCNCIGSIPFGQIWSFPCNSSRIGIFWTIFNKLSWFCKTETNSARLAPDYSNNHKGSELCIIANSHPLTIPQCSQQQYVTHNCFPLACKSHIDFHHLLLFPLTIIHVRKSSYIKHSEILTGHKLEEVLSLITDWVEHELYIIPWARPPSFRLKAHFLFVLQWSLGSPTPPVCRITTAENTHLEKRRQVNM